MVEKKRILFICTHNAARSQIAEGLVNHLFGNSYEASSAGTRPSRIHPMAIRVMNEIGVDVSNQNAKRLDIFLGQDFDYVVTLCDDAEEMCPFFPGREHLHQGFRDPAAVRGNDEEALAAFRKVRDEIRDWLERTFKNE